MFKTNSGLLNNHIFASTGSYISLINRNQPCQVHYISELIILFSQSISEIV